MSMKPKEVEPVPAATARIAHKAFPKGTLAMRLRDALGAIYSDETFAHLFPKRGKPAASPWRLALVTVLQHLENLADRQAAHAVAGRIDWKYALSLELEEEGFDFTILSDFRRRLTEQHAEELVLTPILRVCQEQGWLGKGAEVRTDSTQVVAAVRDLSSVESVGESLRAALNALAQVDEQWLLSVVSPDWFDRYVHRFELARFSKKASEREKLRQQVGEDAWRLLEAGKVARKAVREQESLRLLAQVWQQHYEQVGEQIRWRDGPAVENQERVISPYDPEARASKKRETRWTGYSVHLTETCEAQALVHLIVQVSTCPATTQDVEMTAPIVAALRQEGYGPQKLYVDQGYPSGELLAKEGEAGTQIIGPVGPAQGWQVGVDGAFGPDAFQIQWDQQQALCPQGHPSCRWKQTHDPRGRPIIQIHFAGSLCGDCSVRTRCTRGERRSLTILPQAAYQAREQRKREQSQPAFVQAYARRAGIEGTISQATRTMGLRRARSRGLAQAHLRHLCIAAAINLVRLDALLTALHQGQPARQPRPPSPFARLQQRVGT